MSNPGITADSSAAGLTAQLDEVWTRLAELGRSASDQEWGRSTPCPGWPVSAQYAHVIGTESMLLGRPNPEVDPGSPGHVRNQIGGFNEVWVAALAGETQASVMDRFDEVTGARRQALAAMGEPEFDKDSWTPVGQADYRRFMQIRVFDCWVHEQDVRDAVGRPGGESGPAAEQAIDEVVRALGFVVGKKGRAPEGATVRFELDGPVRRSLEVAVVDGRARVLEPGDVPARATLSMPSGLFTRLACGRTSDISGVRFAGDEALGRQVAENLAFTI